MLTRQTAVDLDMGLRAQESSAGAPEVARDSQRGEPASRLRPALFGCVLDRQGMRLGPASLSRTG
jgi:hypothetical protein